MNASVIIVTIGAEDHIFSCLDALLLQSIRPPEIILIDNSLDPDLAGRLRQLYPDVKIYSSPKNLYYGEALNQGISLSGGEFVLCLNDDVVLDKDFIEQGLKGFSLDKRIGSVSGKIMRRDAKVLDSTGLFLTPWRTAKERGYGQKDRGQFEKAAFIFGASGCAAFYRKEMLESVKEGQAYFDNRFLMFYEDLDIAWRARRRGWLAYYLPCARATHVRGGSFRPPCGINKPWARRYLTPQLHCRLILNRYLTIKKNETLAGLVLHLVPILLYDLCVLAYVLILQPGMLGYCLKRFFKRKAS